MRKLLAAIGVLALATVTAPAFAHPGGGGGGGGGGGISGGFGGSADSHISASGMANTNGPNASDRDFGRDRAEDRRATAATSAGLEANATVNAGHNHRHFGGKSASHVSASGRANTNGPNATDRDFGRDRSSDR